ncbi:MmgE/PrpD family protein [Amycolatopsis magusensis]|uniref:2-methylcitrate dehydratase PrpD n=1 Tax=Amycolatopsis magusensis TaxID=882444 RepID=A0ABS4PWI1_9PSEU|nr:MmgE/PrpD family protein [Amycolatopsis magusensis]MBP2183782.1 2-methylcitrate dehydratase PrpD [Amycolatopsis magusensis]
MSSPLDQLARLISARREQPLPAEVTEAARRTLYNALATTVGAAREPAMDVVTAALAEFGEGKAVLPGRAERMHPLDAALATGIAAHLDDYDDTHLATVIHPGAVCVAALVGLQDEIAERDGAEVLAAFAWGVEAQLRLGVSVSPEHYDAGWHITGTCGAAGAAVTAGLLLGLDSDRLRIALEWAVEGGLGNREGFGSMTKPFHPGKAAVRGLRAALDAAAGRPGPGDTLTGPDGFVARLAGGKFDAAALTGERWELLDNTFKPYPCGIVTHPAIEAAEAVRAPLVEHGGPEAVTTIRLVCHPLVPELTGRVQPSDGLQARFSTAHGIAAGLLLPRVDLAGYATEVVVSPEARRLRSLVEFEATPSCARDAARLVVTLADGTVLEHSVVHARGSLARPLTDAELRAKAEGLVDRIVPGGAAALDAASRHEGPGYVRGLLAACGPGFRGAPSVVSEAEPLDGSEDHALARFLASSTVDGSPVQAAPGGDDRERAAAAAGALVEAGNDPVSAVITAAGGGAVAEAVSRMASRLDIPADRLLTLAAALSAVVARGLPSSAALRALGLAATQTTTVTGPAAQAEVSSVRAAHAAADGVEAAVLGANGFTAPDHPLTGRRALLSLLAVHPESHPEDIS